MQWVAPSGDTGVHAPCTQQPRRGDGGRVGARNMVADCVQGSAHAGEAIGLALDSSSRPGAPKQSMEAIHGGKKCFVEPGFLPLRWRARQR